MIFPSKPPFSSGISQPWSWHRPRACMDSRHLWQLPSQKRRLRWRGRRTRRYLGAWGVSSREIWNFDDFRCLQFFLLVILTPFRSFLNVDLFKYVRDDWSNPSPGFETQNHKQGKWGYIQQFWEYSVTKWGWVKSLLSHDCEIDIHQHQLSCEPVMGTRVLTIPWGETALSHTEFRLRPDLCSKMF